MRREEARRRRTRTIADNANAATEERTHLVEVGPVVVLSSGKTSSSWMLSVLTYSTVTAVNHPYATHHHRKKPQCTASDTTPRAPSERKKAIWCELDEVGWGGGRRAEGFGRGRKGRTPRRVHGASWCWRIG